jgi:hypothetical protein
MLALQSIAKAESKALHPHWTALLAAPAAPPRRAAPATLSGAMLADPLPKVRRPPRRWPPRGRCTRPLAQKAAPLPPPPPPPTAARLPAAPGPQVRSMAAATIGALLEGPAQRAFLAVAEARAPQQRQPVRGFTTLSASLGATALALHAALLQSVSAPAASPCSTSARGAAMPARQRVPWGWPGGAGALQSQSQSRAALRRLVRRSPGAAAGPCRDLPGCGGRGAAGAVHCAGGHAIRAPASWAAGGGGAGGPQAASKHASSSRRRTICSSVPVAQR